MSFVPDGSTMNIEGMPGADQAGYAGMGGDVNNHYFRMFGSALMLSMISAATQLSQPQQQTGSSTAPSAGQVVAGAVGQQLVAAGQGLPVAVSHHQLERRLRRRNQADARLPFGRRQEPECGGESSGSDPSVTRLVVPQK